VNEKANGKAMNDGSLTPHSQADEDVGVPRADEDVGTVNEKANGKAMNDGALTPHSHADEDVGVPRADEDVGAPRANEDVGAPKDDGAPEWYSRGYLPHRDRLHLLQSITFRLADSLPQSTLRQLEQKLLLVPEIRRDIEKRKSIEQWLDAGMGCCALRQPEAAAYVQQSLLHFDGDRYRVLAWVIMPNHVHVLIDPAEPISKTIQGWKSFTSRWLLEHNERLGLGIPDPHLVWMREYWDRFIRDGDHLRATIDYIHRNPVKAGLCREPADWPWSSAAGRADVPVGTVNDGNADVPVGTANEKANGKAGNESS
jgi:type I restriction enzyme R subunit/putative DNA methylase